MPVGSDFSNTAKNAARTGSAAADSKMTAEISEANQNASTDIAIGAMETANANQDKIAAASAANQTKALARSTMLQAIRDLVKDGKEGIKDAGEAGHKP